MQARKWLPCVLLVFSVTLAACRTATQIRSPDSAEPRPDHSEEVAQMEMPASESSGPTDTDSTAVTDTLEPIQIPEPIDNEDIPSDSDQDGVPTATDCDDTDAARFAWRVSFTDSDGDGYTVGEPALLCTNNAPTQGFALEESLSPDCDDSDPIAFNSLLLYPDPDGDGHAAGDGTLTCTGLTAPSGYTATPSEDCAPLDPAVFAPGDPACPAPPGVRFDYFHDGAAIHYVSSEGGTGEVLALPGPAPLTVSFDEADVDETGLFSARRRTSIFFSSGAFFRLEGTADAFAPPAPVRVTTLEGVTQVCSYGSDSRPADRSKSYVLVRYAVGMTCSAAFSANAIVSARLPLTAGPDDAPLPWDERASELRDPAGVVDATLRLNQQSLGRIVSVDDPTLVTTLLPSVAVTTFSATWVRPQQYLLAVQKTSTLWNLYHYDTVSDVVTGPLLQNMTQLNGPGLSRQHSSVYAFLTAKSGGVTKIYRVAKDGSSVSALSGIGTSPSLLAVVSDKLYFDPGAPSSGLAAVAVNDDFAAPTIDTVLGANEAVTFLSEGRAFYESTLDQVSYPGVINLDGTQKEDLLVSSHWIGCALDADHDRPGSESEGLCRHAYLVGRSGTAPVTSYDAAHVGPGFFAAAIAHGDLGPAPSHFGTVLLNRTGAGTVGATFAGFHLPGTLWAKDSIPAGYDYGIFKLPRPEAADQSLQKHWAAGATIKWLD